MISSPHLVTTIAVCSITTIVSTWAFILGIMTRI